MSKLAPYAKAVSGALVAGLGVLLANADHLSAHDYIAALIAFVVAAPTVFYVPYKPTG